MAFLSTKLPQSLSFEYISLQYHAKCRSAGYYIRQSKTSCKFLLNVIDTYQMGLGSTISIKIGDETMSYI